MRTIIAGRVVAVTGGANGIGNEIARQLTDAGARVAIGDRDSPATQRAASELNCAGMDLDVTQTSSVSAFLADVEREVGPPDVLVNCAGVMRVGPFDDEPDTAMEAQVDVNLLGVMRGIKAAAPAMVRRGSGHIVTIASAASVLAPAGQATYAASKHGVLGYLKSLRAELADTGVDVSAVLPAVVDTELAAGTGTGAATLLQPADVARAVLKVIEHPRFEVTVPWYIGPMNRVAELMPAGLRHAVLARANPDQLRDTDPAKRRAYEAQFRSDDGSADGERRSR